MSIKTFCDRCEDEITSSNEVTSIDNKRNRLGFSHSNARFTFNLDVITGKDSLGASSLSWNNTDLCKYCIFELFDAQPQLKRP